jgi:hypothetical protein
MGLRVLFHVGPHKTGTTTLQYAFNTLRDEFASAGVHYPMDLHESGAHHLLAWQAMGRPLEMMGVSSSDVESAEVRLSQWISEARALKCHTVLLSAEDFSILDDEAWRRTLNWVSAYEGVSSTGIVYVTRNTTAMAHSVYGTLVTFGENRHFAEIKGSLIQRFDRLFPQLDAMSSRDGIFDERIRLNFRALTRRGRFVENFCRRALGIKIPSRSWPLMNASLPPQVIEELRQWNVIHSPGVTVDSDTGRFPPDMFSNDPDIHVRRVQHLGLLMAGLEQP